MTESRDEPKLWVSLIVVALLALFMQWLDYYGWLAGPEGRIADALLGGNPRPAEGSPISVIEIDDTAYDACFDSVSPMYAKRVIGLVKGVASASPWVVGIDILTGARIRAAEYQNAADKGFRSIKPKLVWISGVGKSNLEEANFFPWLWGAEDELTVKPTDVLGYSPGELKNRRDILWSVPVFPSGEDSGLRRFPRHVQLSAGSEKPDVLEWRRSWARLVAEEYCRSGAHCKDESADEVLLSYSAKAPHVFAMLDLFDCDGKPKETNEQWRNLQNAAKDKIVLIGGTFQESGDFHHTPLDRRTPGLIVNAYAIQAEIDASGIHEAWRPFAVAFDILIGLAIVALPKLKKRLPDQFRIYFETYEFRWILGGSALLILFAIAITLLLFGRGYLMSFLGVALGALLHQIWEMWNFKASKEH